MLWKIKMILVGLSNREDLLNHNSPNTMNIENQKWEARTKCPNNLELKLRPFMIKGNSQKKPNNL